MDEQQEPQRPGPSKILWLLLALVIVLMWWYFRPKHDEGTTAAQEMSDRALAVTDPDDVLVDLKDNATPAQIAAIERDLGIDLVLVSDESKDEQFYRAHVDPARRDAIIDALSKRPEVEIAEPDAEFSLSPGEEVEAPAVPTWEGYPNDPQYKYQWHMRQIGMPEAWKLADGDGVIVAVLDTGVGYEDYGKFHVLPDLKGIEFVKPFNFIDNSTHAGDDHGHGSHVTGTIAPVTHARSRSCRSRCYRPAARGRSQASPTRFATRPTKARR